MRRHNEEVDPVGELVVGQQMNVIKIDEIPPFINNTVLRDIEDIKRIKRIEADLRGSRGYFRLFQYLKKNCGMMVDGFNTNFESGIGGMRIELHHTPFTLFEITMIVCNRHIIEHGYADEFEAGEEVILLHWKNLVGLYPLSPTNHELVHSNCMDVHPAIVRGNWREFVNIYEPFFPDKLREKINELQRWDNVPIDRIPSILAPKYTFLQYGGIPMYQNLQLEYTHGIKNEII